MNDMAHPSGMAHREPSIDEVVPLPRAIKRKIVIEYDDPGLGMDGEEATNVIEALERLLPYVLDNVTITDEDNSEHVFVRP